MATLTVWKFDSAEGADRAVETLIALSKQELIRVHDAAVVSFPLDKNKPKTRQLNNLVGAGALGGAFWGMLFGLIFLVPLLGAAIGAGMGAMTGALADAGIDDDFIKQARDKVTPGTSALFVMTSDAVQDKVRDAFSEHKPELISSNLSSEQEAALRSAFGESE